MPVYKFDLPGDNGDLFLRYKINKEGNLKLKEQRIKWSGRNKIEDAKISGTGHIGNDGKGNFTVTVVFPGNHTATYSGVIGTDGTGSGTAKSSWQGNFSFKIVKQPKGTKLENLLK